jgi:8-oxo-dGTP diphosphatase
VKQRVAAYAVVVESGRVLLPHWVEGGRSGWTLPGGGIDPGEHPADAAVREVLEETGYRVELDDLLGIDSIVILAADRLDPADGDLHGVRIVYRAHVVGGELRDEADGSTDTAAWFELADVAALDRVELVDTALRMAGLNQSPRASAVEPS